MKNYVQKGGTIDVVLAAVIASGAPLVVGALVGVAEVSGAIGDTVAVKLEGVYTLNKAVGAISQGAQLYWDDTAKNVTTSSASGANLAVGYAFAAALSADATVPVFLWR